MAEDIGIGIRITSDDLESLGVSSDVKLSNIDYVSRLEHPETVVSDLEIIASILGVAQKTVKSQIRGTYSWLLEDGDTTFGKLELYAYLKSQRFYASEERRLMDLETTLERLVAYERTCSVPVLKTQDVASVYSVSEEYKGNEITLKYVREILGLSLQEGSGFTSSTGIFFGNSKAKRVKIKDLLEILGVIGYLNDDIYNGILNRSEKARLGDEHSTWLSSSSEQMDVELREEKEIPRKYKPIEDHVRRHLPDNDLALTLVAELADIGTIGYDDIGGLLAKELGLSGGRITECLNDLLALRVLSKNERGYSLRENLVASGK